MPKANIKSKQGFTIIEVVLVLAIAGLIFLMVFIALPALQRSQRDTQRTDDMARVQSALMSWQNNHNNRLPSAGECMYNGNDIVDFEDDKYQVQGDSKACEFIKEYMNAADAEDDTFTDPSGTAYSVVITENISSGSNLNTIQKNATANDGKVSLIEVGDDGKSISIDSNSAQDAYTMWIFPGGTCSEDNVVPSAKNDYAILMRLEGSGAKCTGASH